MVYERATDALAVVASAAVVLSTINSVRKTLRIRALERSFWVSMDITYLCDVMFGYNAFALQFRLGIGASPRLCSKFASFYRSFLPGFTRVIFALTATLEMDPIRGRLRREF